MLSGLLIVAGVAAAIGCIALLPGKRRAAGVALSGVPLVAGFICGLLNRHNPAALPIGLLVGSLSSFDALAVGVLRGDNRHGTGLYRLRRASAGVALIYVGVALIYVAIVVTTYATSADALRDERGEPLFIIAKPASLVALALMFACMLLSADAFDKGHTRVCIGWSALLLPLGCMLVLPMGLDPLLPPVGLFIGAAYAMFTLLVGLLPPPGQTTSNIHHLRKAHVLAFLGYLGIIVLCAVYVIVWRQLTR
ncbi:hypothetical protein [Actinomyces glycerinitolerans]|uniref:Uncharacterized protein n=1 Tax=Actinomyces glycerinitolerans TaxID=1892869 RepID=A0A1M4RVV1_9ACTO|nr:hypothetical protein [Actinomyces glycerinitolerans]SHE24115.1 Hypothetical protein ACGLYG10_0313 [Actinomyces glycerinitolerans]